MGALQVIQDVALGDLGLREVKNFIDDLPVAGTASARRAGDCRSRTREARLVATTQGAQA
jgi:hypothetical protein